MPDRPDAAPEPDQPTSPADTGDDSATPESQPATGPGVTATKRFRRGTGIQRGALAGRSFAAAIAIVAIPVMIEQFLNATVGLVDLILAGHLPDSVYALDAVGIGMYITWFISIAMTAIGTGGAALIARAMGRGDHDEAHDALGQTIFVSLIWGGGLAIVVWLLAPELVHVGGLRGRSADLFVEYVRILALGVPLTAMLLNSITALHGAGEAMRPFLIMVVVNIVNIGVSWYLSGTEIDLGNGTVIPNPGMDLGVAGIAWGSVAGWFAGTVLILALMKRGVRDLKLELPRMRPKGGLIKRIVKVATPGFIDGIGMWSGNILILAVIGQIILSEQVPGIQGAHMVAIRWESFSFLPGLAIGTAAGTLAGQMLGAGNELGAKQAMWTCTWLGAMLMGLAGIGLAFGGEALTRIISDDPGHLFYAPVFIALGGAVQIFFACAIIIRQGLRGVGATKTSMFITYVGTYGIRLPVAYIVGVEMGYGMIGVWIALTGELILRGGAYLAALAHPGWTRLKV